MATQTIPVQPAADRDGAERSAHAAPLGAADPAPRSTASRSERRSRRDQRTARAVAAYEGQYQGRVMAPNAMLSRRHEVRDSNVAMAPNEMLAHRRGENAQH
ncbi:hypothetical protein [Leucobacter sp. USHLN153]|uniref:hypothetical protein n=1 Tax=Leucobacter sp. USHLN153 TaxID=3081268 RepID=UPI00301B1F24